MTALVAVAFAGAAAGLVARFPVATRAAAKRPHFTDIAPRSHISYISNNDFTGRKYFPQPMCGGVAILDYDNDGLMDIFFTNGAKLPELKKVNSSFHSCLLRNKGDGTFEDVTAKAGVAGEKLDFSFGVAAGDYDNDGFTDLFVADAGRNALYHNNGNGTFTDVTDQSGLGTKPPETLSVQAAWFDYDNDGLLDLVVANYTLWTPERDRRCLRGSQEMYCSPKTYASVPQRLYHNLGGGKFEDVTDRSGFGNAPGKGMGIGIADFNRDGWTDVFIANDTERNLLFLNQGNGAFKEVGLLYGVAYNDSGATVSAMGSDVKDFDNDGWVDVFYNDLMGQIWGLFRNRGGKSFAYFSPSAKIVRLSEAYSGWSAGFIDYNNDGWKDLFSANGDVDNLVANSAQHDTLFENVEGKQFSDVSEQMGKDFLRVGYQRGSALVDLNNDGYLDLVVSSLNQKPRILLNSADNGNHWLLIQATGRKSNRDAIGASFKVTTPAGRTLYNHVTTSVGFMSSSDRRVHFGLGNEQTASSIEVRWPSGAVQSLSQVAADQILRIEEPR
ncbi:MAG: CRTAC1 family protein [Acidobacteriales bacterium]|nr:CRTAC1 family protein [Terriglobales bacterium]